MNLNFRQSVTAGAEAGTRFALNIPPGIFDGGSGVKSGLRSGTSMDFMEHRDYFIGDDLRQIDWNVYARSDKLTVKLYHQEVTPALDILLDTSASMALENSDKPHASLALTALLAAAGGNGGFRYKVWRCAEDGLVNAAVSSPPETWTEFSFSGAYSPAGLLAAAPPVFHAKGIRIFISDLLFPAEPRSFLAYFAANSSMTVIVQVLAEPEISPAFHGNAALVDSETDEEQEFFVDDNVLAAYRSRMTAHQENWRHACRESGAVFTSITAENFMNNMIPEELVNREILRIT